MEPTTVNPGQDAAAGAFFATFLVFYIIFIVLIIALSIFLYLRFAKKAGWNKWMGLLMLVPLVNFVLFIALAFIQWPVEKEIERLRQKLLQLGQDPYTGTFLDAGFESSSPPSGATQHAQAAPSFYSGTPGSEPEPPKPEPPRNDPAGPG
jgi:energy-coupling factor transporter transmembrane protein EcfT